MKVKDLIAQLQALDPELTVMVNGYEGGLKELNKVEVTEVVLDEHKYMSFYGPHERGEYVYEWGDEPKKPRVKAVILPR